MLLSCCWVVPWPVVCYPIIISFTLWQIKGLWLVSSLVLNCRYQWSRPSSGWKPKQNHKRDSKKKTNQIYGALLKGKNAGVRSAMPKHLDEKKTGQIKELLPPSIILFSTGTEHWRSKPNHLIREARRWCLWRREQVWAPVEPFLSIDDLTCWQKQQDKL